MCEIGIGIAIAAVVLASLGGTASTVMWDHTGSETANNLSCGLLAIGGILIVCVYAVLIGMGS